MPFEAIIAGEFSANFTVEHLDAFYTQHPHLSAQVKYLGPQSSEDKHRCFADADILIHPSLNDAFPLVILEAMSASCALVCSDQGGIPEMLDFGRGGETFFHPVISKLCYLR